MAASYMSDVKSVKISNYTLFYVSVTVLKFTERVKL